jgi:hypothetical protein
VRFPGRGALKHPFATALAWTSESPGAEQLSQEVLGAIYRVVYQQRRGLPASLHAMLEQEGLAGQFAGARPALAADELARARQVVAAVGDDPGSASGSLRLKGSRCQERTTPCRCRIPDRWPWPWWRSWPATHCLSAPERPRPKTRPREA